MKISLNNLVKLGDYEVKSLNVEGISYIGTIDIATLHRYKGKDVEELISLCKDKFESKELIEVDKNNNLELKDKYLLSDTGYLKFLEILEDTRTKERYNYMCMNFFNKKVKEEPKQEIRIKDTITSLELLEQINIFRREEGNRTELGHNDLLKVIRDEFEEEISLGKISQSTYINSRGKEYPMFVLTLNQAKQVLMRESKFVRRAVILYLEKLEKRIIELENQLSSKDVLMLKVIKANTEISRAIALNEYEIKYVKPLENNLQEEKKQRILGEVKLKQQEPKVEFYDNIVEANKSWTLRDSAKMLNFKNIGQNILFKILKDNKILMLNNQPYQKFIDCGYFEIKMTQKYNGEPYLQTRVLQKGLEYITKLLKDLGYEKE